MLVFTYFLSLLAREDKEREKDNRACDKESEHAVQKAVDCIPALPNALDRQDQDDEKAEPHPKGRNGFNNDEDAVNSRCDRKPLFLAVAAAYSLLQSDQRGDPSPRRGILRSERPLPARLLP